MPNHIKHSRETRERIYDLYWQGRDAPRKDTRGSRGRFSTPGDYSLKQIEKITGVPASTISKIARGVQ